MGTCNLREAEDRGVISTSDFSFENVVGSGGFSKVWKVRRKQDKKVFALKMLSKTLILYKRSVRSVMNERKLLAHLNHP